MISNLIAPGNKIEIKKIERNVEKGKIKTYYSQIYDIIDKENIVKVAMPLIGTKVILLGMDVNYEIAIINGNGMYICQGTVVNRYKEKKLFVAEIKLYTGLEKLQRRQFFRLESNIDIEYIVLEEKEANALLAMSNEEESFTILEEKEVIKGITLDISGGGIRFTSDRIHKSGEYLRIDFSLLVQGKERRFLVFAEIISSEKIINRSGVYDHRVCYHKISNKDREDLVKFIFEEERRYRKNEKG